MQHVWRSAGLGLQGASRWVSACTMFVSQTVPSLQHHGTGRGIRQHTSTGTAHTAPGDGDVSTTERSSTLNVVEQTTSLTTSRLDFVGGPQQVTQVIPTFRTMDSRGKDLSDTHMPFPLAADRDMACRIHTCMATLQVFDLLCYEAQRQGRFSFYLTSQGEEAVTVASAAALHPQDMVFAQYREQGVLMWRGYSLTQFANQLLGTEQEPGKGRQMPIHYGSRELCYQTISSPLATQMPHAVGCAYAMKLSKAGTCAVAYFGEGASSEGDCHAAWNFACTLDAPVVFICRNNGWAISTPAREQFRGDAVAGRGAAYGMSAVRVDGGDAQAVYNAVKQARATAVQESRPVLVECMSYRVGHHSTSDDSSRYRSADEMGAWRARDPVTRFRLWLVDKGWWTAAQEQQLRQSVRQQVVAALDAAAQVPKPPLTDMFTDVYRDMPWHLKEQMEETLQVARDHPELLPAGMPLMPGAAHV